MSTNKTAARPEEGIIIGLIFLYVIINVMLKNVLFDLDGTISDSREGVIGCFQHTLKELTGLYIEESAIMKLIGTPIRTIFTAINMRRSVLQATGYIRG